jgi:hypothetical protein
VKTILFFVLIPLICAYLWCCAFGPGIARILGIPMKVAFWGIHRKNLHLNKRQYVWSYGVLSMGLGIFVYFSGSDYLNWIVLGDPLTHRSFLYIGLQLVSCSVLGGLAGFFTFRLENSRNA